MTTEDRKAKITELRAYHAGNVVLPATCYFTAKYPHTPEGKDEKCIGLYESEISKGDDIYLELVNMDYTPLDSSRTLYKWEHEKGWSHKYTIKKEQYMIPVSELKVVTSEKSGPLYVAGIDPYKIESEETAVYVTKHYIGADGKSKIDAVWKNGKPHEITLMNPGDKGYVVYAEFINHILNIFNNHKP